MTLPRPAKDFRGRLDLPQDAHAFYEEGRIRVISAHDVELVIPLPEGTELTGCQAVMKDGAVVRHRWSPDASGALVMVPGNSGPVEEIRLAWQTT